MAPHRGYRSGNRASHFRGVPASFDLGKKQRFLIGTVHKVERSDGLAEKFRRHGLATQTLRCTEQRDPCAWVARDGRAPLNTQASGIL
jgi:hypothetical protein